MTTFQIPWTKFIAEQPTKTQLAFLWLDDKKEVFYGGAAGGGKSSALLMGALQHVDKPGYAAMIIRKSYKELEGSEGLIARSHIWLKKWQDAGECRYDTAQHTWYFKTKWGIPARLEFGFLGEENAHLKYQGRAYQYIGFDELTHQREVDYRYLFSRCRKKVCPDHGLKIVRIHGKDKKVANYVDGCHLCDMLKSIKLRVRSTSNPGGPGHLWVKERFDIGPHIPEDECLEKGIRPRYIGRNPNRPFIPALMEDNPHLDQSEYEEMLEELDPVTREQIRWGNWGVSPDSRFKLPWLRYYSMYGNDYVLGKNQIGNQYSLKDLKIFATVDPAASSREGQGEALNITQPGDPSWTVISDWGLTPDFNLIWLDMDRFQEEAPDVVGGVVRNWKKWRNRGLQYTKIEDVGVGKAIYQLCRAAGVPVQPIKKRVDKVVNATAAMRLMEKGRVWIPQSALWRKWVDDELMTWTGNKYQQDDIIDTLSDAANDIDFSVIPGLDLNPGEVDEYVEDIPDAVEFEMPY